MMKRTSAYQGVKNVNFSEYLAYVLNESLLAKLAILPFRILMDAIVVFLKIYETWSIEDGASSKIS